MPRVHPHIKAVMQEMGEDDPVRAVRAKARALVQQFVRLFPGTPPLNLEALASFRGLVSSQEAPKHSPDSEIAPENGHVVLRINRERPAARQRFSIGHEIGHTLFPEYQLEVRCRKPADRDWADPADQLEALCDVAASEFLFPTPWFDEEVARMAISASELRDLASRFLASPEATIRRFVELRTDPVAAMFCSWKLKPTEIRQRAIDRHQVSMFKDEHSTPIPKLRVDYSILNDTFRASCIDHLPKDKSLASDGPIGEAARRQAAGDATLWLDLGTVARKFHIHVIPIYTPDDRVGPDGAVSVAVVVRPAKTAVGSGRPTGRVHR
jgi:Zn-dependent peptidase ImmA (M78 family)